MLDSKPAGVKSNHNDGDEAAPCHDDVEEIPPVSTIAIPAKAIKSDENVDGVYDSQAKEKDGYGKNISFVYTQSGITRTSQIVEGVLGCEGLSPVGKK